MLSLLFRPIVFAALLGAMVAQEPAKPKSEGKPDSPPADKPAAGKALHVSDLAWMSGRWKTSVNGANAEEHWTDPKSNSLMGMFRAAGNRGSVFQLMTIEENEKGVQYRARNFQNELKPLPDEDATLPAVRISAEEASFEDPAGKSVRGVTYKKVSADALTIDLRTVQDGKEQTLQVKLERMK